MDKERLKQMLARWNSVEDFQRLSHEFFMETDGDARQLLSSYLSDNGVYGRVSLTLFGENLDFHRYLLWNIWKSNKGNVREHFAMTARQKGRKKRIRNTPYHDNEKAREVMCWCSFSKVVTEGRNLGTIECCQCHETFHTICARFSSEPIQENTSYVCIVCTNTPKLPVIFRQPFRHRQLSPPEDKTMGCKAIQFDTPKREISSKRQNLVGFTPKDVKLNNRTEDEGFPIHKNVPSQASQNDILSLGLDTTGDDFISQTPQLKSEIGVRSSHDNIQFKRYSEVEECPPSPSTTSSNHSYNLVGKNNNTNEPVLKRNEIDDSDESITSIRKSISPGSKLASGDEDFIRVPFTTPLRNPSKKLPEDTCFTVEKDDHQWESLSESDDENAHDKRTQKNKQTDSSDGEGQGKKIDASKIPTKWTARFTRKEWKNVMRFDAKSQQFEMQPDYGDILQEKLNVVNPVCVIRCNKRELINHIHDSNKPFFKAYTSCKGKKCGVSHIFTLKEKPDVNHDGVNVEVRTKGGKITHFPGDQNKRHLKGKRRKEIKQELKHQQPSNVYRKGYAEADITKVQQGNIDEVKLLKIFQQARVEANEDLDFYKNVWLDVRWRWRWMELATKANSQMCNTGNALNGFIQEISWDPFIAVLYSEDSLTLFRKLTLKRKVPVFLDATSCIAKKLENFDNKRIFYYALVIKSRNDKPVPVCHFFTSIQDWLRIQYCLDCFLLTFKRVYDIKALNFNIARLEIDFSLASITAATRVFVGCDVEQYMRSLWNALMDKRQVNFVIHICRIHTIRFLERQVVKTFITAADRENAEHFLRPWRYRFVAVKTMDQLTNAMEEMFYIIGSKYNIPIIQKILNGERPVDENSRLIYWRSFDIDGAHQNDAFFLRSPFGAYFNRLVERIEELNDDEERCGGTYGRNTLYNPKMVDYMRKTIAPFSPLMTKLPFIVSGQPIENDNTNIVEYWMKKFKNDILGGVRYQKITRVIRSLEENVKGTSALRSLHVILANKDLCTFNPTVKSQLLQGEIKEALSLFPISKTRDLPNAGRKLDNEESNGASSDTSDSQNDESPTGMPPKDDSFEPENPFRMSPAKNNSCEAKNPFRMPSKNKSRFPHISPMTASKRSHVKDWNRVEHSSLRWS